jgi:hypothetical protein
MASGRYLHTATLLPSGKVLVAAGSSAGGVIASAELYDPALGTWTNTGSLNIARQSHTATLLPGGKVLAAGGFGTNGPVQITELYDPATGKWRANGVLNTARGYHTATLLPNGKVLIAGGATNIPGSAALASAELYDPGLGFSNSWQPQIGAALTTFNLGGSLDITGAQFRGVSEASGGNGTQNSATDHPVVQLRSIESGQTVFLASTNWSTNAFVSLPLTNIPPGYALVTVFVNGIPSASGMLSASPAPAPILLVGVGQLPSGAIQFFFTNTPGAAFTALASTDVSAALSNWIVAGSPIEIAAGQFQFTDLQATNYALRFYRVRSP